jgi:hypothetical protein
MNIGIHAADQALTLNLLLDSKLKIGTVESTMDHRTVTDSSGKNYILWTQDLGSSCGPACCFMVYCMVKRQSHIGGEEYQRDLAIKYGAKLQDLQTGGPGVGSGLLKIILEDQGLKIDHRQLAVGELAPMFLSASEDRPIIFHIKWPTVGGHFVVCAGSNRTGAIILDPWYGLVEVPIPSGISLTLKSIFDTGIDYSPTSKNTGTFSGWFARVVSS